MPDIAATGVYSVEGQDALANELAFGSPEAPADDPVATDAGQAFDSGEGWVSTADEADWQDHKLTPADEARLEFDAERTSQFVKQEEATAEAQAYEESFQSALENYASLPAEEQYEVSSECVGRGMEAIAPIVNSEQAQLLNSELFANGADPVPMATTLAFFADNVLQTLAGAGITDMAQLTPEVAEQITDPAMASLFAQNLCQALRMPELLEDGIVNPMEMSVTLLPYVPVLLSGQASDLYSREYKVQFARDVAVAFGQKQVLRNIDADSAVALFDNWAKWGGRLSAGLRYQRQQAEQAQSQPTRSRQETKTTSNSRSPRAKSGRSRFQTNADLFTDEAIARYSQRL